MYHVILFISLIIPVLLIPAFATTFSVDKSNYEYGDTVILSGSVSPLEEDQFLSVQILNPPQTDLLHIDTFSPNSDGSFSRTYKAEGSKWNLDGTYILKLFYNGEKLETSFGFITTPTPQPEPEPISESEPTPEHIPQESEHIPQESEIQSQSESNTIQVTKIIKHEPKTHIPGFPSLNKSPQHYFDRYNNEQSYKEWFDSQFPNESIKQVVGFVETSVQGFPDDYRDPQYYISRYNNEQSYKEWFDSQFPNKSIYQVLGFSDPIPVPDWIKNNAEWWATGKISDEEFISSVQFMIQNSIIIVTNLPEPQISDDKDIPTWIRNNANWWALDKISEEEFVNGIKYLIQQGIIVV